MSPQIYGKLPKSKNLTWFVTDEWLKQRTEQKELYNFLEHIFCQQNPKCPTGLKNKKVYFFHLLILNQNTM